MQALDLFKLIPPVVLLLPNIDIRLQAQKISVRNTEATPQANRSICRDLPAIVQDVLDT